MNLIGRMRLTIRYKILLSFTLVIFIGLLSLLLVSVKITEQNVSRLIDRDMVQTKKTVDLYLKQYFLTRNMVLSADSFHAEADGLVKELGSAVGSTVSIYDSKG
ncbi:sensor histidine kinase, partial [Paenibacillus donghaensis]|nr:sensor histidine kinase [Paenibacillus donghaensis]